MKDHRAGRVSRTKNRLPLMLVYYEYCDSYNDALEREKYFKSGQGRAWLKRKLADDELTGLSAEGRPASGGKIP